MAPVSMQRLADLRSLTEALNLHLPPPYFVSSTGREVYEEAIDPVLRAADGDPLNLYVGVPLCEEHCSFCMYFYGLADAEGAKAEACLRGLERFLRVIAARHGAHPISGSYIGGGTPTVLSAEQIRRLLAAINCAFAFEAEAQRTFEMSPRSATREKVEAIVAGGYNRVSFGVQSFDRAILASVGRMWADPASVKSLISTCRSAGLNEINVDLMTGLDGEQDHTLAGAVEILLDEAQVTISIYRYRPRTSTELSARHGMNDYIMRCTGRVSAAVAVASLHGWQASGRLDGEHIRLISSSVGRWPERNVYETRYRPELRNSLIGVGVTARSFLRDERMVYCTHRNSAGYELGGRAVDVESCDMVARVSAALVNGFFRDQAIDTALVEVQSGLAPEAVFADELAFLIDQGVLSQTGRRYTISPSHQSEWAYLDKLFYPPDWLQRRRKMVQLR